MMDSQLALLLEASRPALPLDALCSDEERAVARALRWGRAGARQVPAIAAEAGIGTRKAQELVKHLVEAHHWPIGTAMASPHGNYLIDDAQDLEATTAVLKSHAISTLSRLAVLQRITVRRALALLQSELDLHERSTR